MKKLLLTGVISFALTTTTFAEGFLMGEETKGAKIKISDDADIAARIRIQPRIDFGDIIKNKDGKSYSSDMDLYLRRIRLEFAGNLTKDLKYGLVFEADKNARAGKTNASAANEVKIQYAFVNYKLSDALSIRFGKEKLPYSRVSLTSSSKQLIVERPASTEAAKKLFDDFYQPALYFHGGVGGGIFNYNLAVADGWENGNTLYAKGKYRSTDSADTKAVNGGPLYVARIELSPPGWTEKSKSDAHLGSGQHFTVGANYATQTSIEYSANNTVGDGYKEDRALTGFDISGHWNAITAQFEYNSLSKKFTDPNKDEEKPRGWYGQAGYFIAGANIEPVVRYEVYDQDSNSSDKKENTTTVGVNWYGKGHSFKLGLNWASTKYDKSATGWLTNSDKKDVIQIQGQLYL